MAIWKLPEEYRIDYSPDGEDLNGLTYKTKYCLEQLFKGLEELHYRSSSTIVSLEANNAAVAALIENESLEAGTRIRGNIQDPQDGQILIYRESDGLFHNETPSTDTTQGGGDDTTQGGGDDTTQGGGDDTTQGGGDDTTQGGGSTLSGVEQDIEHLIRLVNNLYLVLDVAALNPGGYDGLSGETFYGNTNDIDATAVTVTSLLQGSNELTVNSTTGLIEGSNYLLTDGRNYEWVKLAQIVPQNNLVVLKEAVANLFSISSVALIRSYGTLETGKISGDGAFFTAKLFPFVNSATGEENLIRRANLIVKHQNVADAEITAEIALRSSATFVKGEVIGIGDGLEQSVAISHTENLTRYNFALYFDGIKQTQNFFFDTITGNVVFVAPVGAIVSVDYFYNWGEETFTPMKKVGTYPDRRNPNRATTQFSYTTDVAGKVATLRLGLSREEGTSENEIVSTGTGRPKGFKLAHHAIKNTIQVTPSTATVEYNSNLDTVVVTAPLGEAITVSYSWRGKSFSVDSFVCMFNE